ncbi:MAG TPA: hypothetical protein PKM73_11345 [Verrucomicrobiota bacterium]|nr:hypothetical protein [Verrucomicrobiota bacterium]HNU50540.1 hypothetical protein [Verrucomicrobiota bacterium]
MKRYLKVLGLAGLAAMMLSVTEAQAQGQGQRQGRGDRQGGQPGERPDRGNFDPEQMRQRMMERYREALEVKSDDEWKILEQRITKVSEARREVGFGGRGFGGFGMRGGPGGDRGQAGQSSNVEFDDLQKALEAKASAEEIKAKLTKFRDARKAKEAKLQAAQDDLRKLLSVRQEGQAVVMGLLN